VSAIRGQRTVTYWATSEAVKKNPTAPVSVTFVDGGERVEGFVERAAPGKLQLPGGDLLLDAWDPGKPTCNVGY